jgi:hypothetical protein
MAFQTSKTDKSQEAIIDMADLCARIARRKAELGNPELPRNGGKQRTESKKALLKAIEAAGGKW